MNCRLFVSELRILQRHPRLPGRSSVAARCIPRDTMPWNAPPWLRIPPDNWVGLLAMLHSTPMPGVSCNGPVNPPCPVDTPSPQSRGDRDATVGDSGATVERQWSDSGATVGRQWGDRYLVMLNFKGNPFLQTV